MLTGKALTDEESDAMELTLPVVPFGVKQTINAGGAIAEDSGGHLITTAQLLAGVTDIDGPTASIAAIRFCCTTPA